MKWLCGYDERIPKQFMYAELAEGKGPVHWAKLRYKDCIKNILKQPSSCKMTEKTVLDR